MKTFFLCLIFSLFRSIQISDNTSIIRGSTDSYDRDSTVFPSLKALWLWTSSLRHWLQSHIQLAGIPAKARFFLQLICLHLGNVFHTEFTILRCYLHCSTRELLKWVQTDTEALASSHWLGVDISTNYLRAQCRLLA